MRQADGDREAASIAASLGRVVREARRRRRWTQARVAEAVGLQQSRLSQIERGEGTGTPLIVWTRLGVVLGRPLAVSFSRDVETGPLDAGHLAAQELVLRLLRAHRTVAQVELPTRPDHPSYSVDIAVRDDAQRVLLLIEIWNRLDDVGRAIRSTDRKIADAADLATLAPATATYRVAQCWLLVDTAANRALAARYPEVLRSRFPGSSNAWVASLTTGLNVPDAPGLAWVDLRGQRLVPVRRRRA